MDYFFYLTSLYFSLFTFTSLTFTIDFGESVLVPRCRRPVASLLHSRGGGQHRGTIKRGLDTERVRLGTFRGFGTERARLGNF